MKIKEIRIRKLENGYQYEHIQDNGTGVATGEVTGLEAIQSVVGAIVEWEGEKVDTRQYGDELGGEIKSEILDVLSREEPLTITAVAKKVGLGWDTTLKWVLELVDDDKVSTMGLRGATHCFRVNENRK